jgi:hypothetical protein
VTAQSSASDAGGVADASRLADAAACRSIGHYEVGKEGGYLPCCAGLHEELQQVASERGDAHERVCEGPAGYRNYVCVEGSCGDGRCETPEQARCGCPQDCRSAVWQVSDAGVAPAQPDASTSAQAGSPSEVPSLASVQQSYLRWTRHTEKPQAISSEIFSLCRGPSQTEQAFVTSPHGDNLYLLDWLNEAAVRGEAQLGKSPFPVGAAIVKEKLTQNENGTYAVAALGLMLKHEPGFDPSHGDWEFGYWTASAGLSGGVSGAGQCGGCHAASKTDYVYLDQSWRR